MYNIIPIWPGNFELTINVDAAYSFSAMDLACRETRLKGASSDIWEVIYAELATKDLVPTMRKAKSHASIGQVLSLQNP